MNHLISLIKSIYKAFTKFDHKKIEDMCNCENLIPNYIVQ